MMTYEYRFEDVDVRRDPKAYQQAITSYAAEGWRLVQVHVEMPAAVPASVVLILEREQTQSRLASLARNNRTAAGA